jgi:hypothetical protein
MKEFACRRKILGLQATAILLVVFITPASMHFPAAVYANNLWFAHIRTDYVAEGAEASNLPRKTRDSII